MMPRPSAACALLVLGLLIPTAAAAQLGDAYVLPFGSIRVGVEGVHATHSGRFDADGNRQDIGAGLSGELGLERFVALRPLYDQLSGFLEATEGGPGASPDPVPADGISLGMLAVAAAESRTEAMARISVGVLPRLELGVGLPLGRGDRLMTELALGGGNLGVNPDVAGNSALLDGLGWGGLGGSILLPTAESPLGIELQSRVTAATGESLTLPADTADLQVLQALLRQEYALPELASRIERWRIGDLEVNARALLLSTFGAAPVPPDPAGVHLRIAASGLARFPTGETPDTVHLLDAEPSQGLSALGAGGALDLFLGPRLWLTGRVGFTWNRETDIVRRVAPPGAPLSVFADTTTLHYRPGDRIELSFAPRYRLTESISLGAEYSLFQVGDSEFSGGEGADASILDLAGGTLQRVGLGIRYSSLPAHWAGRARVPIEAMLGYRRTLSGPEGAPAGGAVTVGVSVLPKIW